MFWFVSNVGLEGVFTRNMMVRSSNLPATRIRFSGETSFVTQMGLTIFLEPLWNSNDRLLRGPQKSPSDSPDWKQLIIPSNPNPVHI